jgi:hypothetical protein
MSLSALSNPGRPARLPLSTPTRKVTNEHTCHSNAFVDEGFYRHPQRYARSRRPVALTRPIPLIAMQFYPLALATGAIVVLPALGWMTVLGTLGLAHAPMLQRLNTVVEAYPQILLLGPHPSLSAMLGAMQPAGDTWPRSPWDSPYLPCSPCCAG